MTYNSTVVCTSCGTKQPARVNPHFPSFDTPEPHEAPCGLPCRGGGTNAAQFHSATSCDACREKARRYDIPEARRWFAEALRAEGEAAAAFLVDHMDVRLASAGGWAAIDAQLMARTSGRVAHVRAAVNAVHRLGEFEARYAVVRHRAAYEAP